jgi:hypothetical protein
MFDNLTNDENLALFGKLHHAATNIHKLNRMFAYYQAWSAQDAYSYLVSDINNLLFDLNGAYKAI